MKTLKKYNEYLDIYLPCMLAGVYYKCVSEFKKNDPIAYDVGYGDWDGKVR